ncbi:WD40/YVTN/BNR-like repeat-containing protein [Paraferrimonas sedimenticola]|uniref:Photosynthesis system II assembly factor Ycf48/Hcf136-like domain-containing protein n=1 Tax=Paraferrimonas sedimenticola TaxID=375674 RepID=A0AA37W061_9GAMM|nr:YCF48-related protein [Paraferrimonas sedimenticola]GLP98066.1 hypothetical protein GCM10007895_33730 [Paraferrimonas sedimenticola]
MWLKPSLLAGACICALGSTAAAQTPQATPSEMQPLAQQSLTLSIARCNGHMLAVGQRGQILLHETDWKQQTSPVNALLTKVRCEGKRAMAVGHDASIVSSDDGSTWQLRNFDPELENPLLDVFMLDDQHIIAVGAYGLFYRSRDAGQTWQREFREELLYPEDKEYLDEVRAESEEDYLFERAAILPHFNAITRLADGRLLLVGEMGFVAIGNQDASAFERVDSPYEGSFFTAAQNADGKIFVAGLRGNIFSTDNNLSYWQAEVAQTDGNINQLLATEQGEMLAVANGGELLRWQQGAGFKAIALQKGQDLISLAQDAQGELWLAGSQGLQTQAQLIKEVTP